MSLWEALFLGKLQQEYEKIRKEKKGYFFCKRVFDILFSFGLLVMFFPVFLGVAFFILLFDGPPVIFKQYRAGVMNIPFVIWKFRSMKPSEEKGIRRIYHWENGVPDEFIFKSENDNPNVTKVGSFLRKYSLDELPQLINVLKGEMSIVGPRPEITDITACYSPDQLKRLYVKPGLTGWAQVNGRSEMNHGVKMAYDLYYIQNCSLLLDLKIILKTFVIVVKGKGAY
ncbi:sugar transferase [Bacillus timonensis]|nr:sugar transferase [Bacillus timonensis]